MDHAYPKSTHQTILQHLKESDSFVEVVIMAGVTLLLGFIVTLVFLTSMGTSVVPAGHSHIEAQSQLQQLPAA